MIAQSPSGWFAFIISSSNWSWRKVVFTSSYQVCVTHIIVYSSKLRHATTVSLISLPWTYFKSCHALLSLFG